MNSLAENIEFCRKRNSDAKISLEKAQSRLKDVENSDIKGSESYLYHQIILELNTQIARFNMIIQASKEDLDYLTQQKHF